MNQEFNFETDPIRFFAELGGVFELDGYEAEEGWQGEVNRGSRDYMRWVQLSLNFIFGLRLAEDGIKGTQTDGAIRSFQRLRGLTVDGIVGTRTEAALIASGAPQPPGSGNTSCSVNRNDTAYISWTQLSLNQVAGAGLAVDGVNGTRTRAAVRAFQQSRGLTVDGIVGPRTEAALVAAGATRPPTTAGPGCRVSRTSAAYIRWMQQALNQADGAGLVVDGINGTRTKAAVRAFQRARDLTVDGVIGPETEAALIAETSIFPPGLDTPVCGGCAPFNSRVRLHLKILRQTRIPIGFMMHSMRQVYGPAGFLVEPVSVEYPSLKTLIRVDLGGNCDLPPTNNLSAAQRRLFSHRNNVCHHEIAAYFVQSLTNPVLDGCASHQANLPSVIVVANTDEWTLAHEVGHVLGLEHVDPDDPDRLMFRSAPNTNPPPDLVASEIIDMENSEFSITC